MSTSREIDKRWFPITRAVLRRALAREDICPQCGGALDTGFECNDCGYDARLEATWKPGNPELTSGLLIAIGDRAKKAVRDPGGR